MTRTSTRSLQLFMLLCILSLCTAVSRRPECYSTFGGDIELSTTKSPRLLHSAIERAAVLESTELLEIFLARTPKFHNSGPILSELHFACALRHGRIDLVIKRLLNHEPCRPDINRKDNSGHIPLHLIADRSSESVKEAVEALIAAGANFSAGVATGCTPLHVAAKAGSALVVKLLIDAGSIIEIQNYAGKTPCDLANSKRHEQTVQLLDGILTKKKWYRRS